MNIGPQPDGELPAVALERLAEVGEWMKVYGETIYGTVAAALLRILGESLHKEKINYTCIFSNCRIRLSSSVGRQESEEGSGVCRPSSSEVP